MKAEAKRSCPECGGRVNGRQDKKFCSDACRNSHNNRLNSDRVNLMRNVNNILRRNRRILVELEPKGKNGISRLNLMGRGFNFNYFTSVESTQSGKCFFCYEYGYLPVDKEQFAVIKKPESTSFDTWEGNTG